MKLLMQGRFGALAGALAAFLAALGSAALARPPTVTVSPGYDARLAESRKALSAQKATPAQPHPKRKHRSRN